MPRSSPASTCWCWSARCALAASSSPAALLGETNELAGPLRIGERVVCGHGVVDDELTGSASDQPRAHLLGVLDGVNRAVDGESVVRQQVQVSGGLLCPVSAPATAGEPAPRITAAAVSAAVKVLVIKVNMYRVSSGGPEP